MSYDLMVFEPSAAPRDSAEFFAWYRHVTHWSEDHGYNDPRVCSLALQSWFAGMLKHFPVLNGPLRSGNLEDPHLTDYSFGTTVIYCAFNGSVGARGYREALRLAIAHRVGFYAVSEPDAEPLFPAL